MSVDGSLVALHSRLAEDAARNRFKLDYCVFITEALPRMNSLEWH